MATTCCYEFKPKLFGFADCTAERFYVSQWGKNRIAFLIYRFIIFGYAISWIIADVATISQTYYAIFLTNWTEVTGCLYFFLSLLLVVYGVATRKSTHYELSFFHKIVWIVYTTALSAALVTDLLFWGLLSGNNPPHVLANPFNIHSHAINYVLLIIDLFVNDIPIRLLHFIYPVGYALTYAIFTVILYAAKVTPAVYPILNWETHPGIAVIYTLLTVLVAMPVAHLVSFGLYHLRCLLAKCCNKTGAYRNQAIESTEMGGQPATAYA